MTDLPIYLFILVVFANRYLFGLYLSRVKGSKLDAAVEGYEPTITVVVPLHNQGRSIHETILSLVRLDYPAEKLTITVVDDCSTDDSYQWACKAAGEHPNVTVLRNPTTMGTRRGINQAARQSGAEIIVSVDPDVIVFPSALRELVARFTGPEVAAVGGRVHVSNPNQNWLTRLQTIKHYVGQEHLKDLERSLRSVMSLSGCLTAYRRSVLMQCGADRSLARQIVEAGYETTTTTDAMCFTRAAVDLKSYFHQQPRWKRSDIVDFVGGLGHAWRLHPLLCIHYLSMLALLLVYPFIIAFHLMRGELFDLAMLHLVAAGALGLVYHRARSTRALPPWLRVHPLAFLPMAVAMPVAYVMSTPLDLFTLDTASWETGGQLPGAPR